MVAQNIERSQRRTENMKKMTSVRTANETIEEILAELEGIQSEPVGIYPVPKSFREAIMGPDADNWEKSMQEEISSLIENNTFYQPSEKPQSGAAQSKPPSTRCVYHIKVKPDRTFHYKSLLVVRGFEQKAERTLMKPMHRSRDRQLSGCYWP